MYRASQIDDVYVCGVCRVSQIDDVYVCGVCRASQFGAECVFLCVLVGFCVGGIWNVCMSVCCIGPVHDDDDVGVCMMMSDDDVCV